MLLEIERLSKRYRRGPLANDDVSLTVAAGEVYGLLGHNGAGKTTLINQIAGLVRPTAGAIRLAGGDPVTDPGYARRTCAIQLQSHVPLSGVTPRQSVEMMARIGGTARREARERTADLLAHLDITGWADIRGERLPGGVRRLTAFCMAAVRRVPLVILDEPTNDVDPVRRRLLWQQVRALAAADTAVLVVTHSVAEAERGVDRLSILDSGRVVATGTPGELRARHHRASLEEVYLGLVGQEAVGELVA